MAIANIILEYIKVLLWPAIISSGLFLFRQEIRDVLLGLKNISEMKITPEGFSFRKRLLENVCKSVVKSGEHSEKSDIESLFSTLISLPDQDISFLESIKNNESFLPTTLRERDRYNSLCNQGLFYLCDNGAFLPTLLGCYHR